MDSLPPIDFQLPHFIVHHYYISGGFSLVLNLLVIYLIVFHSRNIDSFKYFLLVFQISCILADLNVTVLMQPIGLFPICAGYSNGIMSTVFGWSSHELMSMLTLFLSSQVEILTICFVRKHKAILQLTTHPKLSNRLYYCIYVGLLAFSVTLSSALYLSNESRDVQMNTIRKLYPTYSHGFEQLREFQFYLMNNAMIVFFIMILLGVFKGTTIVGLLVLQMYRMLKEVQTKLSPKTIGKHKTALRSLIAQFMTTPIGMFPEAIVALVVLFPTEYSQKISWYSIMFMTTHSIFNSLVVMITYPEFRKLLFFWRKEHRRKYKK